MEAHDILWIVQLCTLKSSSGSYHHGQMWKGENWVKIVHYHRCQSQLGQNINKRCTEAVHAVGAIELWVRHNTSMRINMKPINQHILVMMTLTFIHVRSTQCACVSNNDVMIINQRYGPDVSNYTSNVVTLVASLCNPRGVTVGGIWHCFTRIHFVTQVRVTGRGKGSDMGISVT